MRALYGFVVTHGKVFVAAARRPSQHLYRCFRRIKDKTNFTRPPLHGSLVAVGLLLVAMEGAEAQGSQLKITTRSGTHLFKVEIASTRAQQERGLMFRKRLAAGHGMLFYFRKVRPISIWMKNTYVSLDIIFISENNQIVRIESDTVPRSLRLIPSREPARAVLEVPAGTAMKLGIGRGDEVTLPQGIQ